MVCPSVWAHGVIPTADGHSPQAQQLDSEVRMLFRTAALLSVLLTLPIAQQKPTPAQELLTARDALIADLEARADAILATGGVQLLDRDRDELRQRIRRAVESAYQVGPSTLVKPTEKELAALRAQVEKAAHMIVAATLKPAFADVVTTLADKAPASGAAGTAGTSGSAKEGSRPTGFTCYYPYTFRQLTEQTSKLIASEPNTSSLRRALAALLASANEPKNKLSGREGQTCVESTRVVDLQRELDALLARPVPTNPIAAPRGPAPGANVREAGGRAAGTSVVRAPVGIVDRLLSALCAYPFCL
jgi:hypothetical protein